MYFVRQISRIIIGVESTDSSMTQDTDHVLRIMYFRVLVILFAFCELYGPTNAAKILERNESTVPILSGSRRIFISLRSGFGGEKQCECLPFHKCDANRVSTVPESSDLSCPTQYVCCDEESPLVEPCQCVSHSQCEISANQKNGVKFIVPESLRCESGDHLICCALEDVLNLSSQKPSQPKCGKKQEIDVRVTGSGETTSTTADEFPWMASIWKKEPGSEEYFKCGASLLSSNIILTAAHCVHNEDIKALKVRIGDYNIRLPTSETPSRQEKSVSTVTTHPNYSRSTLVNDLAVVVPVDSFTITENVYPICTSIFGSQFANSEYYNSSDCLAIGWGSSSMTEVKLSSTLKKTRLKIVPSDQCEERLQQTRLTKSFRLHPSFVCAEGEEGSDTCKGDGGGPLFCSLRTNPYKYVQVGVTSGGIGCGAGTPALYASLIANEPWLSSIYQQYEATSRSSSRGAP